MDIFIRYNQAVSTPHKVRRFNEPSFENIVSPRGAFGLRSFFLGKPNFFKNAVKLYQKGGVGWVSREDVPLGHDVIDKYKVFIPRLSNGKESFPHPILGRPFLGEPNSACTETYLCIGPFTTEQLARNVISYITTRFFRFLVLLNKPTQNTSRKVYRLVPMQDFNKPWTDEELYAKYNLSPEEIGFIESMITPMNVKAEDK